MIVDASDLLDTLLRRGLIGPQDRARLTPLTGGVSSDVFRLDVPGRSPVVVKRSIPKLRVAADWRAPVDRWAGEVAWLRLVHGLDPRLAPLVLEEIPEAQAFTMAWLDPATHPVWKDAMAAGRVDPAFAAAVGRDLARIHAATAGHADVEARFATNAFFHALRIDPFLLAAAERNPDVAGRLSILAADLGARRIALMHGDISPKNILVGPSGPVFLDAECVAYGDPAFDLAFCLSHLLLKTVWLRPSAGALMRAFEAMRSAYAAGVAWEPARTLESRSAPLVAALLLGRVDGKSPAPYLTLKVDQDLVRRAARALLAVPDLNLTDVASRWPALAGL